MYTWPLLHTWPVEKAGNFQFQKGKKEILKNFPKYKSIVYNKLLIDLKLFLKSISRLLWYIFLFLTEHNPSFTLFLICSYFLPNLSFDVLIKCVLMKKRVYLHRFYILFCFFQVIFVVWKKLDLRKNNAFHLFASLPQNYVTFIYILVVQLRLDPVKIFLYQRRKNKMRPCILKFFFRMVTVIVYQVFEEIDDPCWAGLTKKQSLLTSLKEKKHKQKHVCQM